MVGVLVGVVGYAEPTASGVAGFDVEDDGGVVARFFVRDLDERVDKGVVGLGVWL